MLIFTLIIVLIIELQKLFHLEIIEKNFSENFAIEKKIPDNMALSYKLHLLYLFITLLWIFTEFILLAIILTALGQLFYWLVLFLTKKNLLNSELFKKLIVSDVVITVLIVIYFGVTNVIR